MYIRIRVMHYVVSYTDRPAVWWEAVEWNPVIEREIYRLYCATSSLNWVQVDMGSQVSVDDSEVQEGPTDGPTDGPTRRVIRSCCL